MSFFAIGITWVNHHALFKTLAVVDRTLLFVNLTLLLFVVAIPFDTTTVAAYLDTGGTASHLAAVLYAGILEGMAVCFTLIFAWSIRSDERRHEPLPAGAERSALMRFAFGTGVYLVAAVVALVSAPAAVVLIAAVAGYYVFEQVSIDSSPAVAGGEQRIGFGAPARPSCNVLGGAT